MFRSLFDSFFQTWSWSDLGRVLGCSWAPLGRSWVVLGWSLEGLGVSWCGLGRSWGHLGWSWGGLWGVLGCPGRLLGGSWGALGRSKIDQKIDPKPDSKTGRIATEKNGPNTTPVDVSELDQTRRKSDPGSLEIYRNRY